MSENKKTEVPLETEVRTEAEIQAEIDATKLQLEATLSALSYQAQPKVQLELLTEDVKGRIEEATGGFVGLIKDALQGDKKAILSIVAATGATSLLTTLAVRKFKKRRTKVREIKQWRRFARQLGRQDPPSNVEVTVR